MPKGDAKEGYLNTNAHLEAKVALLMALLAESQAREAKLCKLIHDGCLCIAQYGEQPPQPLLDAIAMQTDTSALREMIEAAKAEEREACIAAIHAADDCECGVPCDCFGAGAAIAAIRVRKG